MRNDPKVRALEICLGKLQAGEDLEQILAAYPEWGPELRPLLEAAQAARLVQRTVRVPKATQARSRAVFLQAALQTPPSRSARLQRSVSWVLGIALLIFIVALSFGAIRALNVSAQALPGDRLYSLKIIAERARLFLAKNPEKRLVLEQSYDRERVQEVNQLIQSSRPSEVQFAGALSQMSPQETLPGEWVVGDIRVSVPADAQIIGQVEPGIYVLVEGIVQPNGLVQARRIWVREFEVVGKLQNRLSDQWVIEGVTILVSPDTVIQGEAEVGSQVRVKAYESIDGGLLARVIVVISRGHTPVVEGANFEATATPTPRSRVNPSSQPEDTKEPVADDGPGKSKDPTKPEQGSGAGEKETPQPTKVEGQERTHEPTKTKIPDETPKPTRTPEPTKIPKSTQVHDPTNTPKPTETHRPTQTHQPATNLDREHTHTPQPTQPPESTKPPGPTGPGD